MGFVRVPAGTLLLFASLLLAAPVPAIADEAAPAPAAVPALPATPSGPAARPGLIPTSAFASRAAFRSSRISPDGKLIAMRLSKGDMTYIAFIDAETKKPVQSVAISEEQQLEWFRWAGSQRLLMSISKPVYWYGEEARFSRLISYDLPSNSMTKVGWNTDGLNGDDVLFIDPEGSYVLLAAQKSIYEYPSVYRYELAPAKQADRGKKVETARSGIWDWYADDTGVVRMGIEPSGKKRVKIWYRTAAGQPLKMIARLGEDDYDDKIWDIVRITSGSDEGYVLEKVDGKIALRKFNYATRTSGDIVYRNPDWDVTEAYIGKDGQPSAAYYTDDKDHIVWFDETMKKRQAALEKAMPGKDVWIFSRAKNDERMLISIGNEADPGALFIYTPATRTLDYFEDYRPQLAGLPLAQPRAISYTARDGKTITGYLTLPRGREAKGLPLILLPHGGPYGVRDTLSYDDEVQFLANRGYAILQPNYRGSDGFGEDFEDLGKGQIGRAMQDDLDDAMDWAVKEGIADPGRVCVVGASYGGYAALWAAIRNPDRYRCAASFAGVTDWNRQLRYDNRFFDKKGQRAWQTRTRGEDATFDFATVSPARQVARLTRPVLLAHGDQDSNVPFSQFKDMRTAAEAAKVPLETLVLPGEGHGFAKPESEQRWYDTLGAFLQKHNPAD